MALSIPLTTISLYLNINSMHSVPSVHQGLGLDKTSRRQNLPARRAIVQAVWGDILGAFTSAALRARPIRLCLVSPWLTETDHDRLKTLVRHATRHSAEIVVVTRPTAATASLRALEAIHRTSKLRILTNERLHAKLYVCEESDGRGVALVGSANLTNNATKMVEVGVLVRPLGGDPIVEDLARIATTYLADRTRLSDRRMA
jgi:hypothetical protein